MNGPPLVIANSLPAECVGPGAESTWKVGDRVFGCSLFGAYSSRVVVPDIQIRKIPEHLTTTQAAALPAVSLTALCVDTCHPSAPPELSTLHQIPGRRFSVISVTSNVSAQKRGSLCSSAGCGSTPLVELHRRSMYPTSHIFSFVVHTPTMCVCVCIFVLYTCACVFVCVLLPYLSVYVCVCIVEVCIGSCWTVAACQQIHQQVHAAHTK